MNVVLWMLVLAALAGLIFFYRRLRHRSATSSQRNASARKSLESREERDRRDCLALEMSMKKGTPDQDPVTAGARREARRRSTVADSAFDPDLPAPVKDSEARV